MKESSSKATLFLFTTWRNSYDIFFFLFYFKS